MWYIVVVFFASGLVSGPAHFEENWYPRAISGGLSQCRAGGQNILRYLDTQPAQLQGEAFEVACINADSMQKLKSLINDRWTFERAPNVDSPVSTNPA